MTRTRLTMLFKGSARNRLISFANPLPNLNATVAGEIGVRFILANPFDADTGNITELLRAEVITTDETVLFEA